MAGKTGQKFKAPRAVHKQVQETAQSVQSAPKTQNEVEAATRSKAIMRKMLEGVIGTITFLRELLPDSSMDTIDFDDILEGKSASQSQIQSQDDAFTVTRVARERSDEGRHLCQGIDGAMEALEKGYLEKLILMIYLDNDDPTNIIEAWIMTFDYTADGSPVLGLETTVGNLALDDASPPSSPEAWSPERAKRMMKKIVTKLYKCRELMPRLPGTRYLDMQLFFNESCPAKYAPSAFADTTDLKQPHIATSSTDQPPSLSILGQADSGRHSLSLRVASIADAIPAAADPTTTAEEHAARGGLRAHRLGKEHREQLNDAKRRDIVWEVSDPEMRQAVGRVDADGDILYEVMPVVSDPREDDPFYQDDLKRLTGKHDQRSGDLRLHAQPAILARRLPSEAGNDEETVQVPRHAVVQHLHRADSMMPSEEGMHGDDDVPMQLEETQVSLPTKSGARRYATHSNMNDGDHTSDGTPPTSSDDAGGAELSSSSPGGDTSQDSAYGSKKKKPPQSASAGANSTTKAKAKPKPKAKAGGGKATIVSLAKKGASRPPKTPSAPAKANAPARKKKASPAAPAAKKTPKTAPPRKTSNNPLAPRVKPIPNPPSDNATLDPLSQRQPSEPATMTNRDDTSETSGEGGSGNSEAAVAPSEKSQAAEGEEGDAGSCFCGLDPMEAWWIDCDGCGKWYHGVCSGLPIKSRAPGTFHCIPCRRLEHGDSSEEEMADLMAKLPGLALYRMIVLALRSTGEVPPAKELAAHFGCTKDDVDATLERLRDEGFVQAEQTSLRGKKKATRYIYVSDDNTKSRFTHLFNPGGALEHKECGTPNISKDTYVGQATEESLPPTQTSKGFDEIFPSSQRQASQSQSQSQRPKLLASQPREPEPSMTMPSSAPSSPASRKRKSDTPVSVPSKRTTSRNRPQGSARMLTSIALERWLD